MIESEKLNYLLFIILVSLFVFYLTMNLGSNREAFVGLTKKKIRPTLRKVRRNRENFQKRLSNNFSIFKRKLFGY